MQLSGGRILPRFTERAHLMRSGLWDELRWFPSHNFFILIWNVEVYESIMAIDCRRFCKIVRSRRRMPPRACKPLRSRRQANIIWKSSCFPQALSRVERRERGTHAFHLSPFTPGIRDAAYAESVNTEARHPSCRSCVPLISSDLFQHLLPPPEIPANALYNLRAERPAVWRCRADNNTSSNPATKSRCGK